MTTILDSTKRPGLSAIMRMRQPDFRGVWAITEIFDESSLGSNEGAISASVFIFSTRVASRAVRVPSPGAVTYRLE
ncbi:MAG: hypothetical protein WCA84_10445 [Ignavibacteriaceae bacterium]